ncbi:MAG: hypothetical protein EON58_02280 [Alphaproteobacteria bacterium]|nr:MAG: hypothetical protein EON58_02280 [Alphaproteobacteria bacterium]
MSGETIARILAELEANRNLATESAHSSDSRTSSRTLTEGMALGLGIAIERIKAESRINPSGVADPVKSGDDPFVLPTWTAQKDGSKESS